MWSVTASIVIGHKIYEKSSLLDIEHSCDSYERILLGVSTLATVARVDTP